MMKIKICLHCKKKFKVKKYRINIAKYCSRKCSVIHRKEHIKIHKCLNCNKIFLKIHNPQRKYKYCSKKCKAEYNSKQKRIVLICKECSKYFNVIKYYKNQKFCSFYCHCKNRDEGKTTEVIKIRNSKKYKQWRKSIFERDNYICQICKKRGGKLNADHIKPFSLYPELRFDLDNGRTLCEECHKNTKTFGNRIKRN
jgi:hypothetical protein